MNQQRTKTMVVTLDYTMNVKFMPLDQENQALRFLCINEPSKSSTQAANPDSNVNMRKKIPCTDEVNY